MGPPPRSNTRARARAAPVAAYGSGTGPGRSRSRTRPGRPSPSRSPLRAGNRVTRTVLPGTANRTKIDSTADLSPELRAANVVPYGDGHQWAWLVEADVAFGDITDPAEAEPVDVDVDPAVAPDRDELTHHDGQLELLRCTDVVARLTETTYRHAVPVQRRVHLDEVWISDDHAVPLDAIYHADAQLVGDDDQIVWEHKCRRSHRGDDFAHRQVLLPMLGERARAPGIGRPERVRGMFSIALDPLHWVVQEMAYRDDKLTGAHVVRAWSVRYHYRW